uniref:Potassium channel domain-containing protein n=2 Tax=Plectus sambesii TaxID=2011161 RepID=A0A914UL18_9BILA
MLANLPRPPGSRKLAKLDVAFQFMGPRSRCQSISSLIRPTFRLYFLRRFARRSSEAPIRIAHGSQLSSRFVGYHATSVAAAASANCPPTVLQLFPPSWPEEPSVTMSSSSGPDQLLSSSSNDQCCPFFERKFDPLSLPCTDTLSIISESNELQSPLSTDRTSATVTLPKKEEMMKKKTDRISALKTTEYTQLTLEDVDRSGPTIRTHRIEPSAKSFPRKTEKIGNGWQFLRHFRVLLPLSLLAVYSGLGGLLFWHLEGTGNEEQLRLTSKQKFESRQTEAAVELADIIEWSNGTVPVDDLTVFLRVYAERLGLQPADIKERTFWGSVFFVGTVYTTIGYGNIAPVTTNGRAFTVIYAFVGIPLVLYVLNDLGKIFCSGIWHCYNVFNIYVMGRCCHHIARRRIGEFPISLAIVLTFGWALFCSWLFTLWEDWDIWTSLYFLFQSITTIGFGDITPKRPRYMVFSFVLILVGLALVSMCINLVLLKLEHLVEELAQRIEKNHAVDEEESTSDMANAHESVDKLAHSQSNWLAPLLGHRTKARLINQWEHKMAHRNRGIQTERVLMSHASTAAFSTTATHATQTGGGVDAAEFNPISQTPLREVKRTTSTDELRGMLRDINFILSDCRDIVHRSHSVQGTPIKKQHHFY